jgi:uncharacterized protein (TIRG00374 family)
MLTRAGLPGSAVGTGLPLASLLSTATTLALPVLSLPAILGGTPVNRGLAEAAYVGFGVFFLMLVAGVVVFTWDRPVRIVARSVQRLLNRVRRKRPPIAHLETRALSERNAVRTTLGKRWRRALLAAIGNVGFDYLALLAALMAVGSRAHPSLVLLAYVAAVLLGLVPFTPGGLGFVEAGLAATLVLAGVSGAAALTATLLYRLASFWLPIVAGLIAYGVFRRRYGAERDERALRSVSSE